MATYSTTVVDAIEGLTLDVSFEAYQDQDGYGQIWGPRYWVVEEWTIESAHSHYDEELTLDVDKVYIALNHTKGAEDHVISTCLDAID